MPTMNVLEAVRDAMRLEMRRDPSVFVLGEDIGARGGVFLATDGLFEEFGEDRVIDTPLAESSIIGIALGAAVNGMRPIAEIQFGDFIWPGINQLVGEAAKVRFWHGRPTPRPNGGCVWRTVAVYEAAFTTHRASRRCLSTHPGLKVVAPANALRCQGFADICYPR